MRYSNEIINDIIKREGFVGLNETTIKSKHKNTNSDYGAYYDSRGFLTTGFGSLVSRSPKGSEQEKRDVEKWSRERGNVSPFDLTKDQATSILPVDIDRNLEKAKQQIGDVNFEELPPKVQQSLVSLSYNTGQVGPKTGSLVNKAVKSGSKNDWEAVALEVENWHSRQPKGMDDNTWGAIKNRRKSEADVIRTMPLFQIEDDGVDTNPVSETVSEAPSDTVVGPQDDREAVIENTQGTVDPEPMSPMNESSVDSMRKGTGFDNTRRQELEQERVLDKQEQDKSFYDRSAEFGNNLVNSFITENIVGSAVKNAVINWDVDSTFDPKFNATKMLDFKELTQDIPNENLKTLLEESNNEQQFRNKAIGFKLEQESRQQMSEYMSRNPVKGFVGIGIASALDLTTFIPVTKAARLAGLGKVTKNIPMLARNIGAGLGENLVQDLTQEIVLTNNSDIRKWDDGDILYGAVGGAILGGAAGAFRYTRGLKKYDKLAEKYTLEKNLDGINLAIRNAEAKKYGAASIEKLKRTRDFIEKSLDTEHRKIVYKEVLDKQTKVGQGILEDKKLSSVTEQARFETEVDRLIEGERTNIRNEVGNIRSTAKQVRQGFTQSNKDLTKRVREGEKRLTKLKKMESNAEVSNEITNLTREVKALNNRIKANDRAMKRELKQLKSEKQRAARRVRNQENITSPRIVELEQSKQLNADRLRAEYDSLETSVKSGEHPVLQQMLAQDSLTEIADSLGLGHLKFNDIDDIDEFLGLKFDDSEYKPHRNLSAMGVRVEKSNYIKSGDVNTMFNKIDPDLWNVMARQAQDAIDNPAIGLSSHQVNKNSVSARLLRATHLNKLLTTDSMVGRWLLNKSALRHSDNEFARGFYNWLAPDGAGRLNGGRLSVSEKQQQLSNIFGGQLRTKSIESIQKINQLAMDNPELRQYLELPENKLAAKLKMAEVHHVEKVSNLVRDELIDEGTSRVKFGDDVGQLIENWKNVINENSRAILDRAREAGVEGIDDFYDNAQDNWFHRQWDNKAAIQFDIKYGTEKLNELIADGMRKDLLARDIEITDALEKQLKSQAKKFGYGLTHQDIEVFNAKGRDYEEFLRRLERSDVDIKDSKALRKEADSIADKALRRKQQELARRKPIDLTAEVLLDDGNSFQIRDLLEKNILVSQNNYIDRMSARIAAAENGVTDISKLQDWATAAVELERRRGKLDTANYMERALQQDIRGLVYGGNAMDAELDLANNRLLRLMKKYSYARLMQYTGISSIAELGTLVPEAGYKAMSEAIVGDIKPILKSFILGGVTGKEFSNKMVDELSTIVGVGFEDISFDALVSSSNTIANSKLGKSFERVIDNTAKATRRATGQIETTGRRLAVNALAINFGNIALGRSAVGNLLGGLSNRNLIELGLAEMVDGKAVVNQTFKDIVSSIKKYAVDETGALASVSGKPIREFKIRDWDIKTRNAFGDALTQQANHIIVNPDSTTAKLWHSTVVGSIFNQFRTFANNATSKVAGHNVNQALQGYKMGEMAEISKTAQKLFWGAALGKVSLIAYGALNNAGREDFSERMEEYLSMDDMRDWTKALGRSSAITGFDSAVDTTLGVFGVDPYFNSSTIGQSRNRFNLGTTATGQLVTGALDVGSYVVDLEFQKAGSKALQLSPFRRQLGVNQLLNALGVE